MALLQQLDHDNIVRYLVRGVGMCGGGREGHGRREGASRGDQSGPLDACARAAIRPPTHTPPTHLHSQPHPPPPPRAPTQGIERTEESLNILLEYVPGGSIAGLLAKFGSFQERVIKLYTRQILVGLEYLHR